MSPLITPMSTSCRCHEIDDVTAAGLGCRFITSYRAVVEQGQVRGGQWVAVHGCGGVGLSAIMIAVALGAQVVAMDIAEDKLALAQELGAAATINGRATDDVPTAVREITRGGAHVSLDALGSQETCFNSIANLRKRGKHIQVGLMTGDHHSRSADGPRHRPRTGNPRQPRHAGFRLRADAGDDPRGALQPQRLIGRRINIDEAPAALANMDSFPGTGIMVIDSFS